MPEPPSAAAPMYPGLIKAGSKDSASVLLIQVRLNQVGCGPVPENGVFDTTETKVAVKLFQGRFSDVTGEPLTVDGEVGSLTWGALFGADTVPSATAATGGLSAAAIDYAGTQVGVMEDPLGSNRGEQVDKYLRAAGLDPQNGSYPWCVAFTYYCYQQASDKLGIPNPHIRTAGVLDHWNKAANASKAVRVTTARAVSDPSLVLPGALFIMDFGGGVGHSGIVTEVADGRLVTIEGNTNDDGSRNGIGVFKRTARKIAQINKGFIMYR